MGTLLFLGYINYLPGRVNSTTRLFADDCLTYRTINKDEDASQLQTDLDSLQRWGKEWGMRFNPEIWEVIRITNRRNITEGSYYIHGHTCTTKMDWQCQISRRHHRSKIVLGQPHHHCREEAKQNHCLSETVKYHHAQETSRRHVIRH